MVEPVKLKTAYTQEQQDVLKVLEHMTNLAMEGKVSSIAIAYVRADRQTVSHSWSSSSTAPAMTGAIAGLLLQYQLNSMALARANPDNEGEPA